MNNKLKIFFLLFTSLGLGLILGGVIALATDNNNEFKKNEEVNPQIPAVNNQQNKKTIVESSLKENLENKQQLKIEDKQQEKNIDQSNNEDYITIDIPKLPELSKNKAQPIQNENSLNSNSQGLSPMSVDQIRELRKDFEKQRIARDRPVRTPIPKISSLTLDLSPGFSIPIIRLIGGETSTITFIDSTGQPFPLAIAPRVSNDSFFAEWIVGTNAVIISALTYHDTANITIFLKGLSTPIILRLAANDDGTKNSRIVDYRMDIRVKARGPNATIFTNELDKSAEAYNSTLQSFLDNVAVRGSKKLKIMPNISDFTVWKYNDYLYIRTNLDLLTEFENKLSSTDGTKIYKTKIFPLLSVRQNGEKFNIDIEDNF